ncbi:MAG: hypothetical protein DRH12_02905 [Deltaproteobacteria bacterium]|nr:MAG: hypothetical protein DRH12_02905 [Deltaproteobacteria bacterium]
MAFSHENPALASAHKPVTRRNFLRLSLLASICPPILLFQGDITPKERIGDNLIHKYLGEQLDYQIGFWLLSHCGEARVRLCKSPTRPIFIACMTGKTAGFVDWLVGRCRYSYTSYSSYDEEGDRLSPLYFRLRKKRKNKVGIRTVTFNYKQKELIFARRTPEGQETHKVVPMEGNILYEDYLTLFYNFRNGYYGCLQRDKTYHLPLYIHEGFNYLDLTIGSEREAANARAQELRPKNMDYFVRFRVLKEDVSSKSGKIVGWLSKDAVPVKGVIKDVILFGDLWGVLVKRQFTQKSCREDELL